jgi:hypothetical protein
MAQYGQYEDFDYLRDEERGHESAKQTSPGKVTLTSRLTHVVRRDAVHPGPLAEDARGKVESALGGSGRSLPGELSSALGAALGVDLSGVSIHTDDSAADAARSVNANAFTVGNDIFFGSGKYQPESKQGRELLAHEVAHTAQRDDEQITSGALQVSAPDSSAEREAHEFGERFARGDAVASNISGTTVSRHVLSRDPDKESEGSIDEDAKKELQSALTPIAGARDAVAGLHTSASSAFGDARTSLSAIDSYLFVLKLHFTIAHSMFSNIVKAAGQQAEEEEKAKKALLGALGLTLGIVTPFISPLIARSLAAGLKAASALTTGAGIPASAGGAGGEQSKVTDLTPKGDAATILAALDIGQALADASKQVIEIGAIADALANEMKGLTTAHSQVSKYANGTSSDEAGFAKAKATASFFNEQSSALDFGPAAAGAGTMSAGLKSLGTSLSAVASNNPPNKLEDQLWARWLAQLPTGPIFMDEDEHLFSNRLGSVIRNRRTGATRPIPKGTALGTLSSPIIRGYLEAKGIIGADGRVVYTEVDLSEAPDYEDQAEIAATARVRYFIGKAGKVVRPGVVTVAGLEIFAGTGDWEPGVVVTVVDGTLKKQDVGFLMRFVVRRGAATVQPLPSEDDETEYEDRAGQPPPPGTPSYRRPRSRQEPEKDDDQPMPPGTPFYRKYPRKPSIIDEAEEDRRVEEEQRQAADGPA